MTRRQPGMGRAADDWAAGGVCAAIGLVTLWTPEPWLAAVMWPLAVGCVVIPALLRRDLERRERQLQAGQEGSRP